MSERCKKINGEATRVAIGRVRSIVNGHFGGWARSTLAIRAICRGYRDECRQARRSVGHTR